MFNIIFTDYQNNTYLGHCEKILNILDWGELLFDEKNEDFLTKVDFKLVDNITRVNLDFNHHLLILDVYEKYIFANFDMPLNYLSYKYEIKPIKNDKIKISLAQRLTKERNKYNTILPFLIDCTQKIAPSKLFLNPFIAYLFDNRFFLNLENWKEEYSYGGNAHFFLHITTYLNKKNIFLKESEKIEMRTKIAEYINKDMNFMPEEIEGIYIEFDKLLKIQDLIKEKYYLEKATNSHDRQSKIVKKNKL